MAAGNALAGWLAGWLAECFGIVLLIKTIIHIAQYYKFTSAR
jgi:hypothetical protein